jgi:PhnB protein
MTFPDFDAPHPEGRATSVPEEMAAAFACLRRARTATDELPRRVASSGQSPPDRHWGINPELSRLAGTPGGTPVWLVPGRSGSRMVAGCDGGGGAGPNAGVQADGLVVLLLPTTAERYATFIGVLPDGVTATATNTDGSAAQVTTSVAAFSVSGDLASLTVHTKAEGEKTWTVTQPSTIVTSIQPELWVDRAASAVAFYREAFGAAIMHSVGEGEDIVAQLSIGRVAFWVAAAGASMKRFSPNAIGGTTSRTLLVVDAPEQLIQRALAAGAIEASPVSEEHGWLLGRIIDPFGHEWEIGRPLGTWPPH